MSHVVYPAITEVTWEQEDRKRSEGGNASRNINIPGVREAGWTLADLGGNKHAGATAKPLPLKTDLSTIIKKIKNEPWSWPYHMPVDPSEAPNYYTVIANPVDLQTMEQRIRKGTHYNTKGALLADLELMADNCIAFNPKIEDGENHYYDTAIALQKYLKTNEHFFVDRREMPVRNTRVDRSE